MKIISHIPYVAISDEDALKLEASIKQPHNPNLCACGEPKESWAHCCWQCAQEECHDQRIAEREEELRREREEEDQRIAEREEELRREREEEE